MRLTLRTNLSAANRARFEELFLSLCERRVKSWLVQEYLTADEQAELGSHDPSITEIVTLLALRRSLSNEGALLALADFSGLVSQIELRTLSRAIGEPPSQGETAASFEQQATDRQRPRWHSAEGKLWFGNELLRTVPMRKNPTNNEVILSAFQDANWRSPIPQPFFDQQFPPDIHRAINYLNQKLPKIRFRVQRDGRELVWEPRPKAKCKRTVSQVA